MLFTSSWFRPGSKGNRPTTRLTVEPLEDRDCPSGSYLLVSSYKTDSVLRYDADTGAFVDEFITHRSGGLNQPWGVVIGPHDHNVYVSTGHFQGPGQIKAVLSYDGATGTFLDEFVQRDQLSQPGAAVFGPDGNIYVSDSLTNHRGRVARFDGITGVYLDDFVPISSGGLGHPLNLVFGPSGRPDGSLDLYVNDEDNGDILRYDGTTGAFLGVFVSGGSGGLRNPAGFVFGPDGNLYVADGAFFGSTPAVLRYQGPTGSTPGAFMGAFVPAGSGGLLQPFGVLFGPDRNGDGRQDLYVTSTDLNDSSYMTSRRDTSSVKVYDGITGAYLADFVAAGSGGLNTPILMTFTETDPVTLAYTGATTGPTHATPSASGANASIAAAKVSGAIVDGKPHISIGDVTEAEDKKGPGPSFSFMVTLSAAYDQPVIVSFQTVIGTVATSDNYYVAKAGTLTFAPGETTKTITIEVKGDSKKEADESFYLDLFDLSSNALFTKNRGIGTILNDD